MKTVAFDRKIADILKLFISVTEEKAYSSLTQSVLDYVNILSHVLGNNPDSELSHIVNDFEIKAQVIFRKILETRKDFLRTRKDDAIILDKKLPNCDNKNYLMLALPDELYNAVAALVKAHPYMFSNEKKATIKDVVNRAVLFRVMENDQLMKNDIYRAWRLEMLMRKEKRARISIDDVFEVISKRRRVIWDE